MESYHLPQGIGAARYLCPDKEPLLSIPSSLLSDAILTRFEALKDEDAATSRFLPFAVEASWITSRWSKLKGYLELCAEKGTGDFNVGIGSALCALQGRHENNDALLAEKSEAFTKTINQLRLNVAKSLTANSVASLQSCHDDMLRLHALADVEAIANARTGSPSYPDLSAALKRRLDVLGGYIAEKQYLLGIRRAAMELACVDTIILFVLYGLADFFFSHALEAVLWIPTSLLPGSQVPTSRAKANSSARHIIQCSMQLGLKTDQPPLNMQNCSGKTDTIGRRSRLWKGPYP